MKIKNLNNLSTNSLREKALAIAEAGLLDIDTERAVKERVSLNNDILKIKNKEFSLKEVNRVVFVGVGKCAAESAKTFEKIMKDRISDGVVVDIREPPKLKNIAFYKGTHPFPSRSNEEATDEIIRILKGLDDNDFVIFVISGGGSTLLHASDDISPEEEEKMVRRLFEAGANIAEINTIRKHISLGRGGYLAKHAYPARGVSIIFSDVPTNNLQFIASGPTVRDETTIEEAEKVLAKYDVLNKCNMEGCGLMQTPKDDKYFEKLENIIFVSNETALEAMKNKAFELGLDPQICGTCLVGEAREVGRNIVSELENSPPGTVLLYGGETTVTIKGDGVGGRNQELVLSALGEIDEDELILSIASDGRDNTEHAGALCDKITLKKASDLNLDYKDYLERNDSYTFFEKVGDYIKTGITGSNVSDLLLAIKDK